MMSSGFETKEKRVAKLDKKEATKIIKKKEKQQPELSQK